MRLLHYLEVENFKCFGVGQRIELDHPSVLIGPNNCGKTTALQAIALWSQAVKTWFNAKGTAPPKKRTATALNRLRLVSVPVQRTRFFWHNTRVREGPSNIRMKITVGLYYEHQVVPVTMVFRSQGDELLYCAPDKQMLARLDLLEAAASLNVELLYPMSGLELDEPILQPGRIDVLLGQGQTAQVLRNLCLLVFKDSPDDWRRIVKWINRLFDVDLGDPEETPLGTVYLGYRQESVKERLGISLAGRGLQQMLLILAYLFSHRRSILLIDEPDAHLEILRQKQVYVLLRDIAAANDSQVVLVTHSEVIMDEAREENLTLLLDGSADNLSKKSRISKTLQHFGAAHYMRARQHGYVLYLEGRTDLDILKAMAKLLRHPISESLDQAINAYFVQNNYPDRDLEAEIERVEGGYGMTPRKHFHALRGMLPELRGLAILDRDDTGRESSVEVGLEIRYWDRYEIENYFVTPSVLEMFVEQAYPEVPLLVEHAALEAAAVLDALIRDSLFDGSASDFSTWTELDENAKRLLWAASSRRVKLSSFAEDFFGKLANRLDDQPLLRKGEFFRLVKFADPNQIEEEVVETLDALQSLIGGQGP